MVRVLLIAILSVAGLSYAQDLSPTADAASNSVTNFFDSDFVQINPDIPQTQANHPAEDFAVVSIISLPFTALYGFLGAAIYQSISQNQFPPVLDQNTLATAAGVAVGSSLLIATFSTQWGSGKKKAALREEDQP